MTYLNLSSSWICPLFEIYPLYMWPSPAPNLHPAAPWTERQHKHKDTKLNILAKNTQNTSIQSLQNL